MFIPNYMFDTVYDIPLELFEENGIKYIFFDMNLLLPIYILFDIYSTYFLFVSDVYLSC